jgi:hypothetical protein
MLTEFISTRRLEKLTVGWRVKKYPALYGTRKLIKALFNVGVIQKNPVPTQTQYATNTDTAIIHVLHCSSAGSQKSAGLADRALLTRSSVENYLIIYGLY